MTGPDENWTDSERAALSALREDQPPPEGLEEAVIAELNRRGLVAGAAGRRPRRAIVSLAAAAALLGLGILIGLAMARRPAPASPADRYVLLLEGADTATGEEEAKRVVEYRSWAAQEAAAGRLLSGSKLEPQALALGAGPEQPAGGEAVRGFFVIVAKDDAEALSIARGCPHLRHGGRVIVRRIAKT